MITKLYRDKMKSWLILQISASNKHNGTIIEYYNEYLPLSLPLSLASNLLAISLAAPAAFRRKPRFIVAWV